ncbi:MAG: hypothetical protein PHU63_03240, partial [Candidatus ainarchaeum sp.]|nr:hypothetical protein [Candidatus ainarchaeum sp.]
MGLALIEKPIYKMFFGLNGPIPLMETQYIFVEDVTNFFRTQPHLIEDLIKIGEKSDYGSSEVLAESSVGTKVDGSIGEIEQEMDRRSFDISYENPITKKTEVLHAKTETIKRKMKNPVDQTLETGSTYPVYKFITTPIFIEKIDPYILEEVMKKIEIDSPKPFGGGTMIPVVRVIETTKLVEDEKKANAAREALIEIDYRKEIMEGKINHQIEVLEYAVE